MYLASSNSVIWLYLTLLVKCCSAMLCNAISKKIS